MTSVEIKKVSLDLPVFNAKNRSIKQSLISSATGGKIIESTNNVISIRALDNINFSIYEGDRLAILGHNGAGKTTLLKLINKVYTPTTGEISVSGKVSSLIDISLGIDPEATGRENIFLRGALLGYCKNDIKAKLDQIIEFSELGKFIDLPTRTYSTGMHMRLAFTISTAIEPEILLMDEWLSVGDDSFQKKAETRLTRMLLTTKIFILASHSYETVIKNCNKAIWLENGSVKKMGDVKTIAEDYFNRV